MAAKLSLVSLCAILATAPLGSCQLPEESIAGDGGLGLFGVPTEDYAGQGLANATGLMDLDGYNLTIGVTADVPVPDTSDTTMATVISLDVGPTLRNRTTCVAVYHGLSANVSAAARDLSTEDGISCGSMLTEECISDFQIASNEAFSGEDCSGYLPEVPDSCRDQFGDMSGSGFSIQSEEQQILYQHGSAPAAPGNDTLWLAAATNIWPMFIRTIPESNSTSDGNVSFTALACLRADTFKEGTVRPSAEPNGTESGGDDSTGTGTTGGATPSPTNAASQAGLPVAAAVAGLIFNMAMLFM